MIDTRCTKMNRREIVREVYAPCDFDFALMHIEDLDVFHMFSVDVFISLGSERHLVES